MRRKASQVASSALVNPLPSSREAAEGVEADTGRAVDVLLVLPADVLSGSKKLKSKRSPVGTELVEADEVLKEGSVLLDISKSISESS